MNKHLYRIVFNKARGLLMVVAENVSSQGKSPGVTACGKTSGFSCLATLQPLRFSLLLALGMVWLPAQAEIIADRNAPGNQRPGVFEASNGTPLVNIQTPSAAGVSRNVYSQFDVDAQGVILNNSRTNTQTQLGGWVEGNPWLAGGGARVILNEVNSNDPSRLHGYIEVAGQRAQVVIANPAGISCYGCGFINASRATLTTGQPQLSGGRIDGYLVQDGNVLIEGAGLDASRSDFTEIIARSVEVNAGIWAGDLTVVAGANRVSADQQQISAIAGQGAAPAVAIDVAQLGGMYAGKITLVGNEAGVGVRNAGQLGASAGDVVISADGRLENFGSIASSGSVRLQVGGDLDNAGAQIQALGDMQVTVAGQVDNRGGLLRAGQALSLSAQQLDNSQTQGVEQGLEGGSVSLQVGTVDNLSGVLRADTDLSLSSDGRLDNSQGMIAAGRDLQLTDSSSAASLVIDNADGTLIAGRALAIDAAQYSGDGQALSLGDLSLQLTGDYNHSGLLQAADDLDVKLAGQLINQGDLLAGARLGLQAAALDNRQAGEISAGQVQMQVQGELSNRGLIDAEQAELRAEQLSNIGSGRIYADHLSIAADSLLNTDEQGEAGVIAARERLDIGARSLVNREQALIFSAGDLAIGGELDAQGHASGQADSLHNASATVEALGDLALNVRAIHNSNEHFSTHIVEISRTPMQEFQLSGSPNRYLPGQISTYRDEVNYLVTPEGRRDNWNRYDYTRVVRETQILTSEPGQILAGGNLSIEADELLNDKSQIIAGGLLQANIDSLTNTEVTGQHITSDSGTVTNFYRIQRKGRDRQGSRSSTYRPAPLIQEISLQPSVYMQHATPDGSGLNLASVSVAPALDDQNGSGIVEQVRSGTLALKVPSSALFRPASNAGYLIETDPRFTNYRTWLSSDYMLQRLAVDPATAQKRLGDGFYEQKLIREQVAQLTGRRFLDGHADDEVQYLALIDSAVTLAQAWQLVPGVALSAEQMAQLTSDIVWLVEREVTLADGSTSLALVPQVYVRVREGDLDGHGALLAGQTLNLDVSGDLLNSGSLGARGVAAITAENLSNLGGRIQGNSVDLHARNDLNNLGGQISAGDSLKVMAGRDLNLISNTLNSASEQGSRQMVSRIAGLFVSQPAGQLLAAAGRDLRMQAAQVVNSGAEGQTLLAAGRDLSVGTQTESHTQSIRWDSANWRKETSSQEVGSSIQNQGDLHLQAGNDLLLRASSVSSSDGALLASAGRDIQLSAGSQTRDVDEAHKSVGRSGISAKTTTTRDSFSDYQALTSSLAGTQTVLQAGRDIGSEGAQLLGTDELLLVAGRDINLLTATSSGQQSSSKSRKSLTSADGRSSQSSWQSPEGSQLQGGDIELFAGQDIQLQGSALSAEGAALLSAGRDIDIGSAVHSQSQSSSSHSNRVGFAHHGFLTQEQKAQQGRQTQHEAVGSLLSADSLQLDSGRDTRIAGSQLVADGNIDIDAGRDLHVISSESQASHSSQSSKRQAGEIGEWWQPASGIVKQTEKAQGETTRQVGSQIASLEGDINLKAGERYQQTASSVMALQGDIDIAARNVNIEAGHDSLSHTQTSTTSRTAIGGSINIPIVDAVRGMQQMKKAASHTDDSRMQALAAATVAMQASAAVDSGMALMNGNMSGIKISVNLSNSQNSSTTIQGGQNAVGSSVIAGGDLNISARGGDDSDLNVVGSQLSAGNDLSLHADGDINLLAAQNTAEQRSKNAGSGWNVGVGFAFGGQQNGFTIELAANKARGKADGEDLTHSNTYVSAGNTLSLTSGSDTNLKGAVASGKQVVADIGGDLNLESLQDSSSYKSKQSSASVGLSLCIPPICYGMSSGSGSVNQQKINSDYLSVTEQTGIKAGDGGFQIKTAGNTDLKGAVIASTDKAVADSKNSLITGTLTHSDLRNKAEYDASSMGFSGGYSFVIGDAVKGGTSTPEGAKADADMRAEAGANASAPILLSAKDDASSTTRSGISSAVITITDEEKQKALTGQTADEAVASVNRDVSSDKDGSNALKPIFDEREIQAGFEITTAFLRETGNLLANKAKEIDNKRRDAAKAEAEALDPSNGLTDPQRLARLEWARNQRAEADAINQDWGAGGTYRQIATALMAAAGGQVNVSTGQFVQNMLVNYVQQQGASYIGKLVEQGSLSEGSPMHAALHAIAGCAGAAASGQGCGSGAMGGAAASVLAGLFNETDPNETNAQREAKRNLLLSLVAGIALVTDPDGAATATNAAAANVDNNWLATQQRVQMQKELDEAKDALETLKIMAKWGYIDKKQDVLTKGGVGLGLAEAGWGDIEGMAQFLADPIAGLNGLYEIITSEEVRQAYGDEVFRELEAKIDRVKLALEEGGDANAVQLGRDLGELAWQVGSIATGAGGIAKGGVALAKAGIKVGAQGLETLAGLAKFDNFLAQGNVLRPDGTPFMDFRHLTNPQKMVIGELMGGEKVMELLPSGSKKIGRAPDIGQTGIDDLYKANSPDIDYVIVEYKFGSSVLKKTDDGLQMSDDWLVGKNTNYDRILESVGGDRKLAADVRNSIDGGRVEKLYVHTDPFGRVTVGLLDRNGKFILDPEQASKFIGGIK